MPILRILLLLLFSGSVMAAEQQYRIAIVDKFFPPAEGFVDDDDRRISNWNYGLFDLDRDKKRETYYHGDVVKLIAANPRFSFFTFPMRNVSTPMEEILTNLRKIHIRMQTQPLDALILSWESSTLISAFEKPLKKENVKIYKSQIRDWGHESPSWQATYQVILMLETLAREGVQIYTIAGNGGPGMVNTFSFAEGVTTVGASEPGLEHFVSNNVFVDRYAQAAYTITRVDDLAGNPIGYDVDSDGCPDIPLHRLTGQQHSAEQLPGKYWEPIKGSSFAAPRALKEALLNGNTATECYPLLATNP